MTTRPLFDVARISYKWYDQIENYLLVTIGTHGAVPELWRHWLQQEQKGRFMNDEVMEQVVRKEHTREPFVTASSEQARKLAAEQANKEKEGKSN